MSRILIRAHLRIAAFLGTFVMSSHATAAEVADCIQEQIAFDGIAPLKYATVTNDNGPRLSLHREYPFQCRNPAYLSCKGDAYVIPGDSVAIGKTCGQWAYVQFIGEKSVTYGWAAAGGLALRPSPSHPPDMSIHASPYVGLSIQRYPFRLEKGRGVPVCEAYLQRLNQTDFPNLPSCARPENIDVPGFVWLDRVWVSTEEFNKTYGIIEGFITNSSRAPETGHFKNRFVAWRYAQEIEIENDGTANNVLLWSSYDRDNPECGSFYSDNLRNPGGLEGLILTPDGSQIDRPKTLEVFGRSEEAVRNAGFSVRSFNLPDHQRDFRHIGGYVGVFKYRSLFYFDTFYDDLGLGNFDGERATATDPRLRDTLAVLLNQQGKTAEICTLVLNQRQGNH